MTHLHHPLVFSVRAECLELLRTGPAEQGNLGEGLHSTQGPISVTRLDTRGVYPHQILLIGLLAHKTEAA